MQQVTPVKDQISARQKHVDDHVDQGRGKGDESSRYLITPKHLVQHYPDNTGSSLKHKVTRYDMMQDDEAHVIKVKEHEAAIHKTKTA